MKITLEELQEALICEMITLPQFIEVIIDNFGLEKGSEILMKNLTLAMNNQTTDAGMLSCGSMSASVF